MTSTERGDADDHEGRDRDQRADPERKDRQHAAARSTRSSA
jgi:hypothetical protein